MVTHLNVDVLFAGILNEESEGVSPHRAVGSVAGLQNRGSDWRNAYPDNRLVRMFFLFLIPTLLSLVASCADICTIGLGSLLPFLSCKHSHKGHSQVMKQMSHTTTFGVWNLQADRGLGPDRRPGWQRREARLSYWWGSGSSGSPGEPRGVIKTQSHLVFFTQHSISRRMEWTPG